MRTIVADVIAKSRAVAAKGFRVLVPGEDPLSSNRVTGWSVNFPIAGTCRPTKVCASTCYFANGSTTWPTSLEKQMRLYRLCCVDPQRFAARVAASTDRHRLTFLRWNGGGDLFPQSVTAVNTLARLRPRLDVWVVTRLPELAAQIDDLPNLYVHFSLDGSSLQRRVDFLAARPKSTRYFFSYQAAPGEAPRPADVAGCSVLFFDCYQPTRGTPNYGEAVCPLNVKADISDACESCRRCFDGSAVAHRRSIAPSPRPDGAPDPGP